MFKTQGKHKGVFINQFCMINDIPYKSFNKWFRKTQKRYCSHLFKGQGSEKCNKPYKGTSLRGSEGKIFRQPYQVDLSSYLRKGWDRTI